ncbi:hypothetical protein [Polyangium aurulentum]|uniref:hypothetical protein n=1 Tax=Polyangium aurulentum TaxID=2567896 RepID=UPI0010AEB631|nr:hypothetical protein [Polyangium aurulentum]UQA56009.1 hypothetical protein E8A73_032425 [Polyangium aurulentum]
MRAPLLMLIAIAMAACGRAKSSDVTLLEVGKVARVNGCHIALHHTLDQAPPVAQLAYACEVPEAIQNEAAWWGEKEQPPSFSMFEDDCVRLGETFYCMEKIVPGVSASLRATYKQKNRTGELIERIR